MTGKQGRRCKQLMDDLKEARGYWKLQEEALDRTAQRTRFGRDCGPVTSQTTECFFVCCAFYNDGFLNKPNHVAINFD